VKLASRLAAVVVVAVVATAVAACGSSGGSSGSKASVSACTSTVPGYCDLVAKAQKEGQFVVLSGPEGVGDDGDFYKAFGKQFGLKVTIVGGAADEVNSKIIAERKEGQYTADISSQGDNGTKRLLAANAFEPLEPLIIDPSLKDRTSTTQWRVNYVPWEDAQKTFCSDIAVESQINFAPIYYNTKLVKGADLTGLTSWQSLLDPKWKGRIVMGDIAAGDDSSDVVRAYLRLGQGWFSQLISSQQPKVLPFGSERAEADDLANGAYAIALFPAGEDSLQTAVTQKLPIASMDKTMTEGTTGTPIQRLCAMDHPQDPAVTQLFVNWSLAEQGQAAFNATTNRTDRVALRKDAPQGKISNTIWQLAQETQADQIIDPSSTEYLTAYKAAQDFFKQEFQAVGIKP
jgi:ABC-type Fe3+ transport system substrate-binding protein